MDGAALVERYYAKAKNGRAKRRHVVTKDHWRTLAAFFGGDWLGFVEYLGEQPHEDERVVTALPETKLIVAGTEKAAAIAAKKGIPIEEVERMLGAYWDGGESPVRLRAGVLAEYWREFDAIHARQSPGMLPLWGLVQEGGWAESEPQPWTPYQAGLFRQQFAKFAVPPAQSWFGGDIGLLYAALGQKLSATIATRQLMPRDTIRFTSSVFEALGGSPFERQAMASSREEGRAQAEAQDRHHKLRRLASASLVCVQLQEALGRPPTRKEFGSSFDWPAQVLDADVDAAWAKYEQAVSAAIGRPAGRR